MSSQNKFPNIPNVDIGLHVVLHENIDQTLLNKLHGPMHYKIRVTYVLNGYELYTMLQ